MLFWSAMLLLEIHRLTSGLKEYSAQIKPLIPQSILLFAPMYWAVATDQVVRRPSIPTPENDTGPTFP